MFHWHTVNCTLYNQFWPTLTKHSTTSAITFCHSVAQCWYKTVHIYRLCVSRVNWHCQSGRSPREGLWEYLETMTQHQPCYHSGDNDMAPTIFPFWRQWHSANHVSILETMTWHQPCFHSGDNDTAPTMFPLWRQWHSAKHVPIIETMTQRQPCFHSGDNDMAPTMSPFWRQWHISNTWTVILTYVILLYYV
jgi:hypothetical protein